MIPRYAIVIGAMKAGTTSLVGLFRDHPEVAVASPKEPGFFAFDDVFSQGMDWYESLFSFNPNQHRIAMEGSTDYTKHPFAPESARRIAALDADVRLIYLLRHPLRRMESHASHTHRTRKELGQLISDRQDHSLDGGVSDVSMAASRYAEQLDQYKEFYDTGKLKVITLEALTKNTEAVVADLCAFLDIDADVAPSALPQKNQGRETRRLKTMSPAYRIANAISPVRAMYKALVPQNLRNQFRGKMRQTEKVTGRFKFTPDEEATLIAKLMPDLMRLQSEYGVDVQRDWGIAV